MVNSPISSLTHDISFATWRVATLIKSQRLKESFESGAVDLVVSPNKETIEKMERLISFAKDVEEINETNSSVLLRELANLHSLIEEAQVEKVGDIDISDIFTKRQRVQLPLRAEKEEGGNNKGKNGGKPQMRQAEILDFMRKFPDGCRPGDITANFDSVSKRTIRNDISALIERGVIGRVGDGGPYSYLKIAEGASSPQTPESPKEGQPMILLSPPPLIQEGAFDESH